MLAHNLYFSFRFLVSITIIILNFEEPLIFFWMSRLSVCSLEFQKSLLWQIFPGSVKTNFSFWLCSSLNFRKLPLQPCFSFTKSSTTIYLGFSFLYWSKTVRDQEFRMEFHAKFLIRLICQAIIAIRSLGWSMGRTTLGLNLCRQ